MKTIGYIRVASKEQQDIANSINNQKSLISCYLKGKGVTEYDTIIDTGLGFPNQCDGYLTLCNAIINKEYDLVIATELSRFTRNYNQYDELRKLLADNKVEHNLVHQANEIEY